MQTATLNLKVSPRRMLSEKEAADYLALPLAVFRSDCRIPQVEMPRGRKLYDMRDLDHWIDSRKGGAHDNDDDILNKLD